MATLLCKKCGKKDVFVTTKGKLEKLTSTPIDVAGAISPAVIVGAIALLKVIVEAVVDWLKDENTKYVVCSSCGHYEKL